MEWVGGATIVFWRPGVDGVRYLKPFEEPVEKGYC